jgi:hypothetical protein
MSLMRDANCRLIRRGRFREGRRFRYSAAAFQAVSHLSLYADNPLLIEQAFDLLLERAAQPCGHFLETGWIDRATVSILRHAVRRVNRGG